ncbi:MAG: hypothetical protein OEV91_09860 [Desulfobulbaceae bacterium]|nr:hypothetical protein [Desulfobulbaceae bacterium]
MTKIRTRAFTNRIVEYLADRESFEERRFDSSLYTVVTGRQQGCAPHGPWQEVPLIQGLRFGAHIDLVMVLLADAYQCLEDRTGARAFAGAMADAMQAFAAPLANGDPACFPDPSFLLHGLRCSSLAAVVARFESNGRIIHETLARRDAFLACHRGPTGLRQGIKMLMEEGAAEDCFGLCCYLTWEEETDPHGTDISYIAKASFFLDALRREIVIITLQGQRVLEGQKRRSREYARLSARMTMDPRAFVLREVCGIGRAEGYQRVRVIRPSHHPMHIDSHHGFMGRYEPIIRQAGICEENGCYLEGAL